MSSPHADRKPRAKRSISFDVELPTRHEDSAAGLNIEAAPLLASWSSRPASSGLADGQDGKGPSSSQGAPGLRRLVSSFTLKHEDYGTLEAYQHEAKRLAYLSAPLAGAHFFSFAISLINVAFVGRLGQYELSVAVLATSFFNVTGLSILIGFAGAQETLCGQAFGAQRYRTVGVVLQRAVLLTLVVGGGLCGLWTQAERAMVAIGQDPAIAAGAARYLQLSSPALLAGGLFEALKRYLMAQGVVKPSTIAACTATALAPLYNWLLIFKLGWGLDGAVFAMTAAQLTMFGCISLCTLWYDKTLAGTPKQTWHGWSRESLQGWCLYLRLALPSTAMVCMEWWSYEICLIMAGWLANPQLQVAVMGLSLNTTAALYMFPLGLSSATTVRVSNALGAGLPLGAKRSAHTAACIALCGQLVLATSIFLSRNWWGSLFTDIQEVIRTAAGVFPLLALSLPGDGMNCVLGGVLRGAGRQGLGATLNLMTYWCLGLPLAGLLAFKAGWGIRGLWAGLAITTTIQACAMVVITLRFDWDREAQRAEANLEADGSGGASLLPGPGTEEAHDDAELAAVLSEDSALLGAGQAPAPAPAGLSREQGGSAAKG